MLRWRRAIIADERGLALIFVALGFLAFVSAAMLAVDVGMFMVARTQAQNSADAGALAGAVALVFDDYTDRSATGAAVQSALGAADLNQVMGDSVSVTPADITFPAQDEVRVNVFRTSDRGNPVSTLVASFFGIVAVDIGATATAEAAPANAATCVKPWAVPDKWSEQQTPPWDETDEFNVFYETDPTTAARYPIPTSTSPPIKGGTQATTRTRRARISGGRSCSRLGIRTRRSARATSFRPRSLPTAGRRGTSRTLQGAGLT